MKKLDNLFTINDKEANTAILVVPKPSITIDLKFTGPITFAIVEGDIMMIDQNDTALPYTWDEEVPFYFKGAKQ